MSQAIIYCRISQLKKYKNLPAELSLKSQQFICEEYCQKHNIKIHSIFHETKSARNIENLTQLNEIIKIITEDIVLIIAEVSRLSRNMQQALNLIHELNERQVIIHSVTENLTYGKLLDIRDKFNFRQRLNQAEFESDQISERVNRSIRYRKSVGAYIGGKPGFGYECYIDKDNIRKKKINELEQKIITNIQLLHRQGYTVEQIANYLNEHKLLYRNNLWTPQNIKYVLKTSKSDDEILELRSRKIIKRKTTCDDDISLTKKTKLEF